MTSRDMSPYPLGPLVKGWWSGANAGFEPELLPSTCAITNNSPPQHRGRDSLSAFAAAATAPPVDVCSSGFRMGLTDQTSLHQADDVACTVHPAVLFSIVDHYSRREEEQNRVIGTLLGTIADDGEVTVCSCFPVPHTETEEQVAVNTDFHATMLQLHQRVFPKQQVRHT